MSGDRVREESSWHLRGTVVNCKPKDMAIIVEPGIHPNVNKKGRCGCHVGKIIRVEEHFYEKFETFWTYEDEPLTCEHFPMGVRGIADRILRPLIDPSYVHDFEADEVTVKSPATSPRQSPVRAPALECAPVD